MNIDQIVEIVAEELSKYDNLDSIELEARLGIYDESFDPNIGEEHYNTILGMLDSFDGWLEKSKIKCIDKYNKNLRLTTYEYLDETKEKEPKCIEKVKLKNFTFVTENLPFDFRISISREISVPVSKFNNKKKDLYQRVKTRDSRIFQNASFDLTIVETKEDSNIIQSFEYEIEHVGEFKCKKEAVFQMLYKLLDANYMIDGFLKTENLELPLELFSATMI